MSSTGKVHPQIEMAFRTHGGRRQGAGRKPKGPRSSERHKARPAHDHRHPVHVTTRVVADVSNLRHRDMYMQLREATIVTAKRNDFRIIHMSIQRNHLHLIVEADHKEALSRGMQGFSISAAKRVNATIAARGPPRAGVRPEQLPPSRRRSGGGRANVEGRSVLERSGLLRLEGARGLAGPVAVAADLSPAHRAAPANVAAREGLAVALSVDLDARGPRPFQTRTSRQNGWLDEERDACPLTERVRQPVRAVP